MKTIWPILYIAYTVLTLSGCNKDAGSDCDESVYTIRQVENIDQFIQPYRPGDSLKMEVFHRTKTDSTNYRYTYLGMIGLAVTDSFAEEAFQTYHSPDDCNDHYISIHQVLTFSGDSSLRLRLEPLPSTAYLRVFFGGKEFLTASGSFNKGGEKYTRPAMQVNEKWYDYVNLIPGWDKGKWGLKSAYTDSTYMFYTSTQGIIRFVINDEYVFERL